MIKEVKAKAVPVDPSIDTMSGESPAKAPVQEETSLMETLKAVANGLASVSSRLDKIEGKPSAEYKQKSNPIDVEKATASKEGIDPRITKIVNETLGEDFGVELEPNADRPGFLFTVLVPQRLSDLKASSRPVVDPLTDGYKIDPKTQGVVEEPYFPADRRSRPISSGQSYDAIREHCERVRSYIISYYQRSKKPVPEFKLKEVRE